MKGYTDKSIIVSQVTKMWHILNINRHIIIDENDDILLTPVRYGTSIFRNKSSKATMCANVNNDTSEAISPTLQKFG